MADPFNNLSSIRGTAPAGKENEMDDLKDNVMINEQEANIYDTRAPDMEEGTDFNTIDEPVMTTIVSHIFSIIYIFSIFLQNLIICFIFIRCEIYKEFGQS